MKVWKHVAAAAVLALGLSACGGGTNNDNQSTDNGSDQQYAEGGTFTLAMSGDPGLLNPLNNTSTLSNWFFRFLYDFLVFRDSDGSLKPGLASDWDFDGTTAKFTIRDDVTCSDGSAVTPSVIAKSFAYMKDEEKASVLVGAVIPNRNFNYEADDATNTLTIVLDEPFGLLVHALSFLPVPCGAGAEDPDSLTTTSSGSGPFVLSDVVPSTSFTMAKRDGYSWGINGASTDAAGMPDTVVVQVVETEATVANLLAGGQANAGVVNGPDADRVAAAGGTSYMTVTGNGALLFNQADGHPTADRDVRLALVQALNRAEVGATSTNGLVTEPGKSVNAATPQVCDDSEAASAIPAMDVAAAKATLEGKGITIKLVHSNSIPTYGPTAELVAAAWKDVGVEVTIESVTPGDYSARLFGTGDFDVAMGQFSNPFPSTLTGLLGGPPPPDGVNGGQIDNQAYKDAIATALITPIPEGCTYWVDASKALFEHVDYIPLSDWPTNWMFKDATMDTIGGRPIPTSVRMLAN